MNPKNHLGLIALACVMVFSGLTWAQEPGGDEEARKAFLITRPKAKTGRPRPHGPLGRLGLGYTIYLRDENERPRRVMASREFYSQEAIRLMIESNTDGYLYIFYTENNQNPAMIFPDARLKSGDNRILAHVPYEVPSSHEAEPRFRWFQFNDQAAIERLYLVVTRQPLPGVLTGNKLVAHCESASGGCPWKPDEMTWNQIASDAETATLLSQVNASGQEQTAVERDAVSRGFGLPPAAPAPSVVKMSATTKAKMLTVTVELIHKPETK